MSPRVSGPGAGLGRLEYAVPTDTPPNDVGLTWLDFGAVLECGTAVSCPRHLVDTGGALDTFNPETGAGEPLRTEVCHELPHGLHEGLALARA